MLPYIFQCKFMYLMNGMQQEKIIFTLFMSKLQHVKHRAMVRGE